MNKLLSVCFLILLLMMSSSFAAAKECAKGVVDEISVGYNNADGGNGIWAKIDGTAYYVDTSYNLNDSMGYALLSLLLYSKSTGFKVRLIDHRGTKCDDFQEVIILNE